MTLDACMARAVADGDADPVRGTRAQALWRQGPRPMAPARGPRLKSRGATIRESGS
jgi:hypothetical protein